MSCEPHHTDEVMEFRANICSFFPVSTGQPSGSVETRRASRGGHVNWWPPRSAVPWPPPCSETPLKWNQVSKCKFPENFFSMEQHFQTVYVTIYLWAVSLPILPNLHIEGEREIEIGVVGTFSTLPQINKQSNFKEKPLCS